jgi:outer membrane protein assembly factor BamB
MIGPDGTIYTASSLVANVPSSVVLHAVSPSGASIWSRPYAGSGVSTLAMRGNRAYLRRSLSVTAVDLTTGDVVFDTMVPATSGLAVAEDGTVYVTQSGGSASRISPDGIVLWTYSFMEAGLEGKALCTAPVVAHDGTVRFLASPAGGNGHVYSLDAGGKLAWKASAPTTEFWAGLDAAGIAFTGGPGLDVFSPAGDLLFSADPTNPPGLWGHDGALGNGSAVIAGSALLTIAP